MGLICVTVGTIVLLPLSKWFLSKKGGKDGKRGHSGKTLNELVKEYGRSDNLFRLKVVNTSLLKGMTIIELDVRRKYGVNIIEVRRSDSSQNRFLKTAAPQQITSPHTQLQVDDVLYVRGAAEKVEKFIIAYQLEKLESDSAEETSKGGKALDFYDIGIAEIVLMPSSKLINQTVKECGFRDKFNVNILGIRRNNEYMLRDLGNQRVHSGDVLLVQGTWANIARLSQDDTEWVVLGQPLAEAAKVTLDYTIPDSVTTVGGYAFSGCGNLNAVYITDLVAWCNIDFVNPINNGFQLEANPLAHAQNLYLNGELITELVIPESVTDIKFLAFIGCSASNIVFHDNVKSIGACAFEHCQNLDNVVIGNSVESIGNVAFGRCPNLTSVTMSDSLTSFGFNVFLYSSNLREFKGKLATEDGRALIKDNILFTYANASGSEYIIPDGITIIGDGAFFSSVGLKSITIPKSVTTIGYLAFGMITDIESIYCKATTPPSTGGNIYESNSCNIYVPFESYQDYVTAGGWSQYAASILPYDYDNNCVIEANASEETKRWLGKWSSTVSRTYCPQTGFNEETVTFEVNIEHNAVAPNFVKVYGLSVIDPTIAVDGIVNANGDLEILNFNYIGNSGEWALYVWALSEVGGLTGDRHAVYTMSMDESGRVSCEVGSFNSSPYIVFDIFGYNVNTGGVSWYNTNISYYSGPMSWVKIADNGATPSRYSQKISYRHNLRLQADARLRVVE